MNGWDWFRAFVCFALAIVVIKLVFDIHPAYAIALQISIMTTASWMSRIEEHGWKNDH